MVPFEIPGISIVIGFFLSYLALSAASNNAGPENAAESVVVVGKVFCDTCLEHRLSENGYVISGASIAVECGLNMKTMTISIIGETDENGEFKVQFPYSFFHSADQLNNCWLRPRTGAYDSCTIPSKSAPLNFTLQSASNKVITYSAGTFSYRHETVPPSCYRKGFLRMMRGRAMSENVNQFWLTGQPKIPSGPPLSFPTFPKPTTPGFPRFPKHPPGSPFAFPPFPQPATPFPKTPRGTPFSFPPIPQPGTPGDTPLPNPTTPAISPLPSALFEPFSQSATPTKKPPGTLFTFPPFPIPTTPASPRFPKIPPGPPFSFRPFPRPSTPGSSPFPKTPFSFPPSPQPSNPGYSPRRPSFNFPRPTTPGIPRFPKPPRFPPFPRPTTPGFPPLPNTPPGSPFGVPPISQPTTPGSPLSDTPTFPTPTTPDSPPLPDTPTFPTPSTPGFPPLRPLPNP